MYLRTTNTWNADVWRSLANVIRIEREVDEAFAKEGKGSRTYKKLLGLATEKQASLGCYFPLFAIDEFKYEDAQIAADKRRRRKEVAAALVAPAKPAKRVRRIGRGKIH